MVSAFKIGDKVRGIRGRNDYQKDVIGKVGRITEVDSDGGWSWVKWDDGSKRDVHHYNLELVEVTKVTRFKIGDRVRPTRDYYYMNVKRGDIKTITDFKYASGNGRWLGYVLDGTTGHWDLREFELVTDDIKVGDYVSIDKSAYFDGVQKTGTVESIIPSEPVVLVRSDSGQTYARKPSELTPAVKPDPIPAEPAHSTAFKFDGSGLTWVWDKVGWSYLDSMGNRTAGNESWASLWGRYVGRNNGRNGFTVL